MKPEVRIALVQDAVPYLGGAERVLGAILELYPQADLHTLIFDRRISDGTFLEGRTVRTSWLNVLPAVSRYYQSLAPLLPLAVEQIDLQGYDLILSISYAFAHGVLTAPNQFHINYTTTPLRYVWQGYRQFVRRGNPVRRLLLSPLLHYLRLWDAAAAQRVDSFQACSEWIAGWIWRAYRRPAQVIYPPVDVDRFKPASERDDYYILVSRLVEHKRVDLIIEAFNRLGLPLLVVGTGPLRHRLQARAQPNIRFLGWQADEAVAVLLGRAKAFVYAGQEDFGIALAEAQAAGCPLIAWREGGASEIVIPEETGLLFDVQSVDAIVVAVRAYESGAYRFDPQHIQLSAQRFSRHCFQQAFAENVESLLRLSTGEKRL